MLFFAAYYHISCIETNRKDRLQLDLGAITIVDSNCFCNSSIHNSIVNF
jgi:hypothetical protein